MHVKFENVKIEVKMFQINEDYFCCKYCTNIRRKFLFENSSNQKKSHHVDYCVKVLGLWD